jgi:hypothetical protein
MMWSLSTAATHVLLTACKLLLLLMLVMMLVVLMLLCLPPADTQLVAAMGLPGGGRNPITPRILRHFNVIAVNQFDDASYTKIYTAIVDWCGGWGPCCLCV